MKVHKEGYKTIFITLALAIMFSIVALDIFEYTMWAWVAVALFIGFTIFILSFFRVPKRVANGSGTLVSAPADGKIVIVGEVEEPEYFKGKRIQVSVFMSFFNVHVNWFPISGEVVHYKYHPGKYVAAFYPKSSEKNERTTIVIRNENGTEILTRQIAGLVARRVVCYAQKGKMVEAGGPEGFIKFGSRADIFLPLDAKINVKVGDKVVGSESIIAEIK
ncbi:MAG: phosphatidylserine decarboxylase family protein [Bacteroidales bacterium]|jgi:phosphatidylserine decarboxylase|nr:phosphatidylserine decarboxylase family protein [Bacteroidales bacterium]MBQ2243622.1 phosphatidylserine decarboxylase family protein [Bacteroidales bacterium]